MFRIIYYICSAYMFESVAPTRECGTIRILPSTLDDSRRPHLRGRTSTEVQTRLRAAAVTAPCTRI